MLTAASIAIWSLATMAQNAETPPELAPLGTVLFQAGLDGPNPLREWTSAGAKPVIAAGPGDAKCVVIERPAADGPGSAMVRTALPVEKIRGCRLRCEALVAAVDVGKPPHPWSGVKFMIHTVGGGEDTWQQQDNLFGSFDWRPVRFIAAIPAGATSAEVALGLEASTGTARFAAIRLTVIGRPRSVSHFAGTMDRRVDVPRLRGAMIPTNVTAAELEVLASQWKANHVRWQLTWGGFPRSPADGGDLAAYDTWLNTQLDHVDALLPTCAKMGIHVLIDLHTPPGGRDDASVCRLFQNRKYQDHFLAVWDRIARRYVGKATVWGYDLVNEPVEGVVPDGLRDWHALALETARRVRAIDKDHAIIVEPAPWGSLAGLDHFEPLDVPGVIYSAHMYEPHLFTHQGVHGQGTGVTYPGTLAGREWNKEQVRRTFGPAIRYQKDYHVPIYIGEFSAIRWAPGAAAYLRDVIEVMEENQWDWAYHAFREWDGWSVEHGTDRDDHRRATSPTDRELLLRSYFARNVPSHLPIVQPRAEGPAHPAGAFKPAGELARRIALSSDRLTGPGFPAYSPNFVLADVELRSSYERLYQNFSGDISGRYLEALCAAVPERRDRELDPLLPRLLRCQRADGRFGREDLDFSADAIGTEHMALLWGNGRLLTGLLARHRARPDPAVLEASRRLGDFLLRIRGECSRPEVAKRLEGMGAKGLICFTQLVEPLTLLGQATCDRRYWSEAKAIVTSLPPRGVQHTHGYLATLRGILLLQEVTGDPALLRLIEDRYDDLLGSPDYLVDGGVLEFFGAQTKNLSPEDLRKLWTLDTKDPQDEGCAEADLVRLGLHLWRRTGRQEALAAAERCLFNHFFFNQFVTGDFGHHTIFKNGWRPSEQPGMAWWCCTMHGYRAFADILQSIVTRDGEALRVNLYVEGSWSEAASSLRIERLPGASADESPDRFRFHFADAGPDAQTLCLRQPDWARPLRIRLNGREMTVERRNGFVSLRRIWHAGDELIVTVPHIVRLETRDGRTLRPEDVGSEPVEAALFYGPYLLAVHEADQPLFFRRPWMFPGKNASTVELPENWDQARVAEPASNRPEDKALCPVAFRLAYHHGGWPNTGQVVFRPLSWSTTVPQQEVVAVWTHFRRAPRTAATVPTTSAGSP